MRGDLGVTRGLCGHRGMRRWWPLHWGNFTRYTDWLTTAKRQKLNRYQLKKDKSERERERERDEGERQEMYIGYTH